MRIPSYQVWVSNMCQDELMIFLEDTVFDPEWDWGMTGKEIRRIHDLVVAERGPQEQVTGKHRSKV